MHRLFDNRVKIQSLAQFPVDHLTQSCLSSLFYSFESFSHQRLLMVFRGNLKHRKSPQVFRTFLSILADLRNVVVWMVSICPLISKFFSPFANSLRVVSSAPTTIGIIVTFMFYSFFSSLASFRNLSLFSPSFNFIL